MNDGEGYPIAMRLDQRFRRVHAGRTHSAALVAPHEIRVWGAFRDTLSFPFAGLPAVRSFYVFVQGPLRCHVAVVFADGTLCVVDARMGHNQMLFARPSSSDDGFLPGNPPLAHAFLLPLRSGMEVLAWTRGGDLWQCKVGPDGEDWGDQARDVLEGMSRPRRVVALDVHRSLTGRCLAALAVEDPTAAPTLTLAFVAEWGAAGGECRVDRLPGHPLHRPGNTVLDLALRTSGTDGAHVPTETFRVVACGLGGGGPTKTDPPMRGACDAGTTRWVRKPEWAGWLGVGSVVAGHRHVATLGGEGGGEGDGNGWVLRQCDHFDRDWTDSGVSPTTGCASRRSPPGTGRTTSSPWRPGADARSSRGAATPTRSATCSRAATGTSAWWEKERRTTTTSRWSRRPPAILPPPFPPTVRPHQSSKTNARGKASLPW